MRGYLKVYGIALQWVVLQQNAFLSLHVLRGTCFELSVLGTVASVVAFT